MAITPRLPIAPKVFSVTNQDQIGVIANPIRGGLILMNLSVNNVHLGFGTAAIVGSGICLLANGGFYNMNEDDFTRLEVHFIAAVAGPSSVSIQEYSV